MSFRLILNSVTLDDRERLNSPNRRVISPYLAAFGADYVKVVEDTLSVGPTFCRTPPGAIRAPPGASGRCR